MSAPYFLHTFLHETNCDDDLRHLLSYISRAAKYVIHAIRHENLGLSGKMNIQGEEQLALDIRSDHIFCQHLKDSNLVNTLASEEQEETIRLMETGSFAVAFDPLDGSSLLDSNFAVGSIFGIYRGKNFIGKTGRQMVAAGYVLYGPRTTLVCSIGQGVHEFLLNDLGEFQCVRENLTVAETAGIFAPGNLRVAKDRPEYEHLVNSWMEDSLTLRYSGGMVPDVNMIFSKGHGIFSYPSSPQYPSGKLRLLYECAPMAFLMEQAGGAALSETGEHVLDIPIEQLHQRTSIFLGSPETVQNAVNSLCS